MGTIRDSINKRNAALADAMKGPVTKPTPKPKPKRTHISQFSEKELAAMSDRKFINLDRN